MIGINVEDNIIYSYIFLIRSEVALMFEFTEWTLQTSTNIPWFYDQNQFDIFNHPSLYVRDSNNYHASAWGYWRRLELSTRLDED